MHALALLFRIFIKPRAEFLAYVHSYAGCGSLTRLPFEPVQPSEMNRFATRQKKVLRPLDFKFSPKYNANKSHLLRALGSREVRP